MATTATRLLALETLTKSQATKIAALEARASKLEAQVSAIIAGIPPSAATGVTWRGTTPK